MSAQDPGAATGQIPTQLGYCTCRRKPVCIGLENLHKPNDAGVRMACSNSNCPCKRYTEEATDA